MTETFTFLRDQYNGPDYRVLDDAYSALGSMLVSDVQNDTLWCLRILGWVEDMRSGRPSNDQWGGNSWSAELAPDGLHLQDLYSDDWRGDYSLDEAHDVVLKYFDFLAPGTGEKERAIAAWEAEAGRVHPCRPHL